MANDNVIARDTYSDATTTPTRSNTDDTHLDYDPDSGFSKNKTNPPHARSHDEYGYDEFTRWVTGRTNTKRNKDEIDDMEDTIF